MQAGKLQDVVNWIKGNTPDKMCQDFGTIYKKNAQQHFLSAKEEETLRNLVYFCGARNLTLMLGAPEKDVKGVDETISFAHPYFAPYLKKR